MHEIWELKQKQNLPLSEKINVSLDLIKEWYEYWGGKYMFRLVVVRIVQFCLIWQEKFILI